MKRSEAFYILDKMLDGATSEQAEAINMAQNDLEFVDLMPNDMVAVVRCKDCKHYTAYKKPVEDFDGRCTIRGCETDEAEFCSYGERADNEP